MMSRTATVAARARGAHRVWPMFAFERITDSSRTSRQVREVATTEAGGLHSITSSAVDNSFGGNRFHAAGAAGGEGAASLFIFSVLRRAAALTGGVPGGGFWKKTPPVG